MSRIVIVSDELGSVAFTGLDRVKVISSSFSLTLSSIISRGIVAVDWPELKFNVQLEATKSSPAVAVLPTN